MPSSEGKFIVDLLIDTRLNIDYSISINLHRLKISITKKKSCRLKFVVHSLDIVLRNHDVSSSLKANSYF